MSIIHASIDHPPTDLEPSGPVEHKKKKKRRRRDEDADAEGSDDAPREKKKKKKRSKHHESSTESVEKEERVEYTPGVVQEATGSEATDEVPTKSKKSKEKDKDKGKQTATPPSDEVATPDQPSPTPAPQTDSDLEASAAALLSALVAAASASSDGTATQTGVGHPPLPPAIVHGPANLGYPLAPYAPIGPSGQYAPPHPSSHQQSAGLFPTPTASLNELSFGSNEDVLRALQALDMSKITNAFRNLDAPIGPDGQPAQLIPVPRPGPGFNIQTESRNRTGHKRILDMALPGKEHLTAPDHAWALANKWMNAAKLAELVRTEGLVYKKGKFSAIEEQQLKAAIANYQNARGFDEGQMQDLIFPSNEKNRDNAFWSEITSAIPQRPIIAVYHHVRRIYHPFRAQGKWSPDEDNLLKQAVADLGQQWEKVSQRVGRMSSDCRDRYRNHLINRDVRVTGTWSKEEEEELTRIVTELTVSQGKDMDNDVFWGRVSEVMGGRRGRQQCRIKWTDSLCKTVKNDGTKPRWSQQDAYILIHKIDALNVRDDTEIDWKTLSDPSWHLWSAHTLQRRWLTMKRGVKGFEEMTHQEIMDILRVKKAQPPAPPTAAHKKRKTKKVVSAAAVTDDAGGEGEASTGKGRQDPASESDSEGSSSD